MYLPQSSIYAVHKNLLLKHLMYRYKLPLWQNLSVYFPTYLKGMDLFLPLQKLSEIHHPLLSLHWFSTHYKKKEEGWKRQLKHSKHSSFRPSKLLAGSQTDDSSSSHLFSQPYTWDLGLLWALPEPAMGLLQKEGIITEGSLKATSRKFPPGN